MAAEFSNQEKRFERSRRSACITNPSGFPQCLLVSGPAGPAQGAAADRTAAFLLPRAGVDQSLPYMALGHCHQTLRWLLTVTISGVRFPLRVGGHCAATAGALEARSLKPGWTTFRPVQ